jgi:hypothetical protein
MLPNRFIRDETTRLNFERVVANLRDIFKRQAPLEAHVFHADGV